jgi:hypothetical protein
MIQDKFGVVFILPECAFAAELERGTIATMMKDIEERLDEQGAPEEPEARCEIMTDNALAMSNMIANHEIDHTQGISHIAYSFVYALGKAIGFEQIDNLRGLTGSYIRNRLVMNPCLAEFDYQQDSTFLSKKMQEHDERGDDEWDYDINVLPTLH